MDINQTLCRISMFAITLGTIALSSTYATKDCRAEVYELRTYTTNEGKLENLNARFRDHTVGLFEKHGMESVGYWVPTDGPQARNTLIYVLKHESREAAKASWKAFIQDPEWKKVAKESQLDGQILAKRPESVYMNLTEYSPKATNDEESEANEADTKDETADEAADAQAEEGTADDSTERAVYELRVYRTNEGKLAPLDSRFKNHTISLFKRHGIESVAYWHPADEPDSAKRLIYIVRHESRDAAKASWKAFSADEEWKAVATESQLDGKFLSERPESTYMKPTDYSALK